MNDETNPAGGSDAPEPRGVPSEWAPPGSSLPPPPSAPPSAPGDASMLQPTSHRPAMPASPPVLEQAEAVVATAGAVVVTEPAPRGRWLGRGVSAVVAAALLGGGGYLVLKAGSSDGGAESPDAALDGALAALSAEDLIGAAEFVEPTERETLVDAGFDVVDELIRLEVFADTLDLSSIDGVDLAFEDVEIEVDEVRPGLAHLFVRGGKSTGSIDGRALPFGPLITDRIDEDDLSFEESATEEMEASESPIVAVERDGRWYLSLWYTVAENARLALGASLPDQADRLSEIGADTPERAVENFVGALERLDVSTMIGLLDPKEAAALYDYGSLFVGDAQRAADEFLAAARDEGWTWGVTSLDLRADVDGNQAEVFVDGLGFSADGPETAVRGSFSKEGVELSMTSPDLDLEMVQEGDCTTVTFDEGFGPDTETICADEILGDMGLSGAFGAVNLDGDLGIVVRNVGGRWYISPTRTGSSMLITALQAFDAEGLADFVDGFVDAFAGFDGMFSSSVDTSFFESEGTTFDDTDYPFPTEDNAHLLAEGPEYIYVYDLVAGYRDDLWNGLLFDTEQRSFSDGVVGQVITDEGAFVEVVALAGIDVGSDAELAEWLGGEVVTTPDGFVHVALENSWGAQVVAARSSAGIAIVASYDGSAGDATVDLLRTQVGG